MGIVVKLQVGNWKKAMRVAVAPVLPVAVPLGKDLFEEETPVAGMRLLVETRAMRKCNL